MEAKKDFYYSKQQETHCSRMDEINFLVSVKTKQPHFMGFPYTECTPAGKKPMGIFNDYIKLGTGTDKDICFL